MTVEGNVLGPVGWLCALPVLAARAFWPASSRLGPEELHDDDSAMAQADARAHAGEVDETGSAHRASLVILIGTLLLQFVLSIAAVLIIYFVMTAQHRVPEALYNREEARFLAELNIANSNFLTSEVLSRNGQGPSSRAQLLSLLCLFLRSGGPSVPVVDPLTAVVWLPRHASWPIGCPGGLVYASAGISCFLSLRVSVTPPPPPPPPPTPLTELLVLRSRTVPKGPPGHRVW